MSPTNQRPALPAPLATAVEDDGIPVAEPGCAGFYTSSDSKNLRRFNLWVLAATLAYLAATAALHWRESIAAALPWLLTGLASLLAIQAARRYVLFLRRADELLRRIQTEALAFGFGSGAVFSLLYPLLERLGAPEVGQHATPVVMMLSWSAGSWLGARRYCGSGAA